MTKVKQTLIFQGDILKYYADKLVKGLHKFLISMLKSPAIFHKIATIFRKIALILYQRTTIFWQRIIIG